MIHLKHYPREHYSTIFNPGTGFYARVEEEGHPQPFWSQHGPELIDISITNWCDRSCSVCYRQSDLNGSHIEIANYEMLVRQASAIGVMQVALGGGNPNQHPKFEKILKITREKYGIVPSYTTNGRGITPDIARQSAALCGAVAVSAYQPFEDVESAIKTLANAGTKVNLHVVLDAESIERAIQWLLAPPGIFADINAIVFINYKPIGRGAENMILANSPLLRKFFQVVENVQPTIKLGFDSCMVSGLASFSSIPGTFYESCEAGRFSMFVSETMQAYPCSFMESGWKGISITGDNLLAVWQNGQSFIDIREKIRKARCEGCTHEGICMGGCPVFPQINLCSKTKFPTPSLLPDTQTSPPSIPESHSDDARSVPFLPA